MWLLEKLHQRVKDKAVCDRIQVWLSGRPVNSIAVLERFSILPRAILAAYAQASACAAF